MKYPRILFVLLLVYTMQLSGQETASDSIKSKLNMLETGLKQKDSSTIQSALAPLFSVSTNTWPSAQNLLNIIIQNIEFESVELVSEEVKNDIGISLIKVNFVLKNGQKQKSIIAFDDNSQILFIDYFDRLFGQSRYWKSSLKGIIPFKQTGESIILTLSINNSRPLSFLLDTGADGMAISKSLADSLNVKVSHSQNANVVGGQSQVNISSGNTVFLSNSVVLKNQNMAVFDKIRGGSLDGIIGLNLIKQYITEVNFDKKQISLYSFGDYQYEDVGKTIPISTPYKLILVPAIINIVGKKDVNATFLMDTGANYYLIAFSRFVRKNRLLLSGFKPESEGTTTSLGHTTPVFHGKTHKFSIGDNSIIQHDMPVTLQASSFNDTSQGNSIPDGSIGIKFFSNYNFTIDLLKKEIHLTPRKN